MIQNFVWTVTTILMALTTIAAGSPADKIGNGQHRNFEGIVNLDGRGMLVMSVARRLGSEGPLLAYCGAPL